MFQRGVASPIRALCRQRHQHIFDAAATTRALSTIRTSSPVGIESSNSKSAYCHSLSRFPPSAHAGGGANHRLRHAHPCGALAPVSRGTQIRTFQNVGHYHNVADDSLHSIQDAVEDYLEEHHDASAIERDEDMPEVNYAAGVLTMFLPPHGTWILNKQTPNEQIWWSSPISGPRRYEYDENRERWVYSRVIDEGNAGAAREVTHHEEDTLGEILNKEFEEIFGKGLDVDGEFHC